MSVSNRTTSFACFVTGTDTEIGKTLVAAALMHGLASQGLSVAAMKPVAAGTELQQGRMINEDVEALLAQATISIPPEQVTPYLWNEPIAPHIAAQNVGVVMRSQVVVDAFRQIQAVAQAVVVEGAGGFCVPLSDTEDMADMAQKLGLPVVLVVGLRLGCISHAVLTAQAIRARGLTLCGWVANTLDPAMPYLKENIQTLKRRLDAPFLGCVPWLAQADPVIAASHLDFSCISGWPSQGGSRPCS